MNLSFSDGSFSASSATDGPLSVLSLPWDGSRK